MNYYYLAFLPLIALVSVLDFSFVKALPLPLVWVEISVLALVLIVELHRAPLLFFWAFFNGLFLDLLEFNHFGANIISFMLAAFLSRLILVSFLTARSLYSFLAVNVIFLAVKFLVLLIYGWLPALFSDSVIFVSALSLTDFIKVLFLNSVLISILYYSLRIFTKKLNPAFIQKRA